jgi:hypothetical protein
VPAFPDLSTAPFAVPPPGASPELVVDRIVACFGAVAALDRPATKVFEVFTAETGLDPLDPPITAGSQIAAKIDRGVAGRARNAYDNSRHRCEVVLCSLFRAVRQACRRLGRRGSSSPRWCTTSATTGPPMPVKPSDWSDWR